MRSLFPHLTLRSVNLFRVLTKQARKTALSIAALLITLAASAPASAQLYVPDVQVGQHQFYVTTLFFPSAVTLSKINVVTQGAWNLDFRIAEDTSSPVGGIPYCALGVAYPANYSCNVRYYFAPTAPGTRYGAIVAYDTSGAPAVTQYLEAIGVGGEPVFYPYFATSIPAYEGATSLSGLVVDSTGSIIYGEPANNQVVKLTATGTPWSYTPSLVGDNLVSPTSVAIDGAGNGYISDTYKVVKLTLSGGVVPQESLYDSAPGGVTVDGVGSVYISNPSEQKIYKEVSPQVAYNEVAAGEAYSQRDYADFTSSGLGTAYGEYMVTSPYQLATDGAENIYAATEDTNGNSLVVSVSTGDVLAGLTQYSGSTSAAAFDPVVVELSSNNSYAVAQEPDYYYVADSGGYVRSNQTTGFTPDPVLGQGTIPSPTGIAVDSSQNVYILDPDNARIVVAAYGEPAPMAFGYEAPGTDSAPMTVTLYDRGTVGTNGISPLILGDPAVTITGPFEQVTNYIPACSNNLTLNVNGNGPLQCFIQIVFTPPSGSGPYTEYTGTAVINDSAGQQTIQLSGYSGTLPPAT